MAHRYLYGSLVALAIAGALVIPAFAQPGWSVWGGGCGGMGLGPAALAGGPVTIDVAVARVRQALAAAGFTDLVPDEVMEFSNHFYVLVKEKSTEVGAIELIVERNGMVLSEPGPNMMWNTKYGHTGGFGMMGWEPRMMGGPGWYGPGTAPGAQPISKERARQIAAQYLANAFPGARPDEGTAFYGYFTFDAERGGKTFGMLGVNAFAGQVWYHSSWHGTFVQEKHF